MAAMSGPVSRAIRGTGLALQAVEEAALEVAGEGHARVDPGEPGAHRRGQRDRERQVGRALRTAAAARCPRNAPDVATRMNSGMTSDGMNTDGMRRTSSRLRPASPSGHARAVRSRAPARRSQAGASTLAAERHRGQHGAPPPRPISVARACTPSIDLVAHPLHQVRDGVDVGDGPEPAGHGLAREEGRREEEQHEEQRERCPARPRTTRCEAPGSTPEPAHGHRQQDGRTASRSSTPADAALAPARRRPRPMPRNRSAWIIASMTPARRGAPRRMATRETGEATSRSKNPPSMSSAKAAPAPVPPIRTPWRIGAGDREVEEPAHRREPRERGPGRRRTTR